MTELFTHCVLPGCRQLVAEPGEACPACVTAFGSMLRPADTRLTGDEISERDAYVARAYYTQRSIR